MKPAGAVVIAAALLVSCVRTTKPAPRRGDPPKFRCQNRTASFVRNTKGVQDGVVVSCMGASPFIRRWATKLDTGHRREVSHSLTPVQFSSLWMNIGSTGWYRLRVCKPGDRPGAQPGPATSPTATVFRVTQGNAGVRLECVGKGWPRQLSQLYRILTKAGKRYAPWAGARMPR